jgi:F0F1-type ATP synthase delta subunit
MSRGTVVAGESAGLGSGSVLALVRTAVPLSGEQRSQIVQSLRARYGANLEAKFEVDPDVLGGIWLSIGDRILDGTIMSKLGALQEKLVGASPFRGKAVAQAHARIVPVALVKTAVPLSLEEEDSFRQHLLARFGEQVQIRFQVDPALLGGAWVRVGDEVMDGSIIGRLSNLRKALVENGGES